MIRRTVTPLRVVTVALVIGAAVVFWPLWPALLLAAWTAALARPLLVRFERGLKGRTRAAAALSLLLFVVLALPLALVLAGVVAGAQELIAVVKASPSATEALESLLSGPTGPSRLPSSLGDVVSLAQNVGSQGVEMLGNLAGVAATALIGLFIYFGGAYVLLLDSASVWRWMKAHSPLEEAHLERFAAAFHETGRGLLVGVGLTMLAQGLAATIIYFALGVPRAWVLGPITGMASVIPMVGSALVWAPIALGLFLTHHPIKALILLGLGVGVISVVDNVLRPIFARLGELKMPTFVLFVAVFGGLSFFGTWGALLGPLIVRLAMEALSIAAAESGEAPSVSGRR